MLRSYGTGHAGAATIIWRLHPDEHLRAVRTLQEHHTRGRIRLWRELRVLALALLAAAMVAMMVAQFRRTRSISPASLWVFAAPALVLALYHATRPLALRRAVRRHLRRNRAAQEERRYTLDEAALRITGDSFAIEVPWPDVQRIEETPDFFLFFSKSSAYYLPKRAIVWPDRVEIVREMLARCVGERFR